MEPPVCPGCSGSRCRPEGDGCNRRLNEDGPIGAGGGLAGGENRCPGPIPVEGCSWMMTVEKGAGVSKFVA